MSLDGGKFICLNDDGSRGEEIAAKGRTFSIGYYMSCDYVVQDARAKGLHCEIRCDAFGRVTIHNMSEEHPICINDKSITIKRPLLNGTRINILDKQYLWEYVKSTSAEYEDLNSEDVSTPQKQIGIPEQPPTSCPNLRLHREVMKRFTVHNFAYYIQSDDEGNTSAECSMLSPSKHQEPEQHTSVAEQAKQTETNDVVTAGSNPNLTTDPQRSRSKTPEYKHNIPLINITNTPDEKLIIDATDNKENSTSPIKQKLLAQCQRSDMLVTSFSPRETGVRIEKSFAKLYKPKTPKSVYSTPKGVFGDRINEEYGELIDFSTPATSLKALKINTSMHLIDLTTPGKLRPASPLPKSALKSGNGKLQCKETDLGVRTLPSTPIITVSSCANNTPSTIGSVISVDSASSLSVIEVTSDESTPGLAASHKTPLKTPIRNALSKTTTTPRRTPQSLMKRALLTSAKKQDIATPKRVPGFKRDLLNTPENSDERMKQIRQRRQCLTTPTSKRQSLAPELSMRPTTSRRSSLIPAPINATNAMTSTPLAPASRNLRTVTKTSPLHRTRKSTTLVKAKVRKSTSPIVVSNKLVAKARKTMIGAMLAKTASATTPSSVMREGNSVRAKRSILPKKAVHVESKDNGSHNAVNKTELERQATFTVDATLESKDNDSHNAVNKTEPEGPATGTVDATLESKDNNSQNAVNKIELERQATFTVDATEVKVQPKNVTLAPKDTEELEEQQPILNKTFSPLKKTTENDTVDEAVLQQKNESIVTQPLTEIIEPKADEGEVETDVLIKQIDEMLNKSDKFHSRKSDVSEENNAFEKDTADIQTSSASASHSRMESMLIDPIEDLLLGNIEEIPASTSSETLSTNIHAPDANEYKQVIETAEEIIKGDLHEVTNSELAASESNTPLLTCLNTDEANIANNETISESKITTETPEEEPQEKYEQIVAEGDCEDEDIFTVTQLDDGVEYDVDNDNIATTSAGNFSIVIEEPSECENEPQPTTQDNSTVTIEAVNDDDLDEVKDTLHLSQPIIELADSNESTTHMDKEHSPQAIVDDSEAQLEQEKLATAAGQVIEVVQENVEKSESTSMTGVSVIIAETDTNISGDTRQSCEELEVAASTSTKADLSTAQEQAEEANKSVIEEASSSSVDIESAQIESKPEGADISESVIEHLIVERTTETVAECEVATSDESKIENAAITTSDSVVRTSKDPVDAASETAVVDKVQVKTDEEKCATGADESTKKPADIVNEEGTREVVDDIIDMEVATDNRETCETPPSVFEADDTNRRLEYEIDANVELKTKGDTETNIEDKRSVTTIQTQPEAESEEQKVDLEMSTTNEDPEVVEVVTEKCKSEVEIATDVEKESENIIEPDTDVVLLYDSGSEFGTEAIVLEQSKITTTSKEQEEQDTEEEDINLLLSQSTADAADTLCQENLEAVPQTKDSLIPEDDSLTELEPAASPIKSQPDEVHAAKTPNMRGVRDLLKTPKDTTSATPNLNDLRHIMSIAKSHVNQLDTSISTLFATPCPNKVRSVKTASNNDTIELFTDEEDMGSIVEIDDEIDMPKPSVAATVATADVKETSEANIQTGNVAPIYEDISEVVDNSICEEISDTELSEKLVYHDDDDDEENAPEETVDYNKMEQDTGMSEVLNEMGNASTVDEANKTDVHDIADYEYGKEVKDPQNAVVDAAINTPKSTKRVKIEESSPRTPSMCGMREMLKTPKVYPKTPKLVGLRDLVRTPKNQPNVDDNLEGLGELVSTPKVELKHDESVEDKGAATSKSEFLGMREMLKTPKTCSTPHFKGLREMVQTPKQCSTPNLGGLQNLMDTPTLCTPISRLTAETSDDYKQNLTVAQGHVDINDTNEGLDKFFRTPRAKHVMIPNEPASAVLKPSGDSVELLHSTEYSLNATTTTNLEELFKTPVATRFAERLADTVEDDEEHNILVREQEGASTSTVETPNRKTLPQDAGKSPFSLDDVITDLPKKDVQEWVDSLEEVQLPDDKDFPDVLNQTEAEEVSFTSGKDISSDPLSASIPKNNSLSKSTAKVAISDPGPSDGMVDVSIVSAANDPLSNECVADVVEAKSDLGSALGVEDTNENEISGINLLDQTDGSLFSEPLLVSDTDTLNRTLDSCNDDDAKSTKSDKYSDDQRDALQSDANEKESSELNEPLLLSSESVSRAPVETENAEEIIEEPVANTESSQTSESNIDAQAISIVAIDTPNIEQSIGSNIKEEKPSEENIDFTLTSAEIRKENEVKTIESTGDAMSTSDSTEEKLESCITATNEPVVDLNTVNNSDKKIEGSVADFIEEVPVEKTESFEQNESEHTEKTDADDRNDVSGQKTESSTAEFNKEIHVESTDSSEDKEVESLEATHKESTDAPGQKTESTISDSNEEIHVESTDTLEPKAMGSITITEEENKELPEIKLDNVTSSAIEVIQTDSLDPTTSTRRIRKASSCSQLSDVTETTHTPSRTRKVSQTLSESNLTPVRRSRRKASATDTTVAVEEPQELEIIPEDLPIENLVTEKQKLLKEELLSGSTPRRTRRNSKSEETVSTPARQTRRKSSTAENILSEEPNVNTKNVIPEDASVDDVKTVTALKMETQVTSTPRRTRRASATDTKIAIEEPQELEIIPEDLPIENLVTEKQKLLKEELLSGNTPRRTRRNSKSEETVSTPARQTRRKSSTAENILSEEPNVNTMNIIPEDASVDDVKTVTALKMETQLTGTPRRTRRASNSAVTPGQTPARRLGRRRSSASLAESTAAIRKNDFESLSRVSQEDKTEANAPDIKSNTTDADVKAVPEGDLNEIDSQKDEEKKSSKEIEEAVLENAETIDVDAAVDVENKPATSTAAKQDDLDINTKEEIEREAVEDVVAKMCTETVKDSAIENISENAKENDETIEQSPKQADEKLMRNVEDAEEISETEVEIAAEITDAGGVEETAKVSVENVFQDEQPKVQIQHSAAEIVQSVPKEDLPVAEEQQMQVKVTAVEVVVQENQMTSRKGETQNDENVVRSSTETPTAVDKFVDEQAQEPISEKDDITKVCVDADSTEKPAGFEQITEEQVEKSNTEIEDISKDCVLTDSVEESGAAEQVVELQNEQTPKTDGSTDANETQSTVELVDNKLISDPSNAMETITCKNGDDASAIQTPAAVEQAFEEKSEVQPKDSEATLADEEQHQVKNPESAEVENPSQEVFVAEVEQTSMDAAVTHERELSTEVERAIEANVEPEKTIEDAVQVEQASNAKERSPTEDEVAEVIDDQCKKSEEPCKEEKDGIADKVVEMNTTFETQIEVEVADELLQVEQLQIETQTTVESVKDKQTENEAGIDVQAEVKKNQDEKTSTAEIEQPSMGQLAKSAIETSVNVQQEKELDKTNDKTSFETAEDFSCIETIPKLDVQNEQVSAEQASIEQDKLIHIDEASKAKSVPETEAYTIEPEESSVTTPNEETIAQNVAEDANKTTIAEEVAASSIHEQEAAADLNEHPVLDEVVKECEPVTVKSSVVEESAVENPIAFEKDQAEEIKAADEIASIENASGSSIHEQEAAADLNEHPVLDEVVKENEPLTVKEESAEENPIAFEITKIANAPEIIEIEDSTSDEPEEEEESEKITKIKELYSEQTDQSSQTIIEHVSTSDQNEAVDTKAEPALKELEQIPMADKDESDAAVEKAADAAEKEEAATAVAMKQVEPIKEVLNDDVILVDQVSGDEQEMLLETEAKLPKMISSSEVDITSSEEVVNTTAVSTIATAAPSLASGAIVVSSETETSVPLESSFEAKQNPHALQVEATVENSAEVADVNKVEQIVAVRTAGPVANKSKRTRKASQHSDTDVVPVKRAHRKASASEEQANDKSEISTVSAVPTRRTRRKASSTEVQETSKESLIGKEVAAISLDSTSTTDNKLAVVREESNEPVEAATETPAAAAECEVTNSILPEEPKAVEELDVNKEAPPVIELPKKRYRRKASATEAKETHPVSKPVEETKIGIHEENVEQSNLPSLKDQATETAEDQKAGIENSQAIEASHVSKSTRRKATAKEVQQNTDVTDPLEQTEENQTSQTTNKRIKIVSEQSNVGVAGSVRIQRKRKPAVAESSKQITTEENTEHNQNDLQSLADNSKMIADHGAEEVPAEVIPNVEVVEAELDSATTPMEHTEVIEVISIVDSASDDAEKIPPRAKSIASSRTKRGRKNAENDSKEMASEETKPPLRKRRGRKNTEESHEPTVEPTSNTDVDATFETAATEKADDIILIEDDENVVEAPQINPPSDNTTEDEKSPTQPKKALPTTIAKGRRARKQKLEVVVEAEASEIEIVDETHGVDKIQPPNIEDMTAGKTATKRKRGRKSVESAAEEESKNEIKPNVEIEENPATSTDAPPAKRPTRKATARSHAQEGAAPKRSRRKASESDAPHVNDFVAVVADAGVEEHKLSDNGAVTEENIEDMAEVSPTKVKTTRRKRNAGKTPAEPNMSPMNEKLKEESASSAPAASPPVKRVRKSVEVAVGSTEPMKTGRRNKVANTPSHDDNVDHSHDDFMDEDEVSVQPAATKVRRGGARKKDDDVSRAPPKKRGQQVKNSEESGEIHEEESKVLLVPAKVSTRRVRRNVAEHTEPAVEEIKETTTDSHTETEDDTQHKKDVETTPKVKPAIAKRGRKASTAEHANKVETPMSQRREGRNLPRRNYDESSDNEIPIDLKRRPSKSDEGVAFVTASPATMALAAQAAAAAAAETPGIGRGGRQRKPTSKVQQYLEEERARTSTPKRRLLLTEQETNETPKKTPARRGRLASTTQVDATATATTIKPATKRGGKRGAQPTVTHSEESESTESKDEDTETVPTTQVETETDTAVTAPIKATRRARQVKNKPANETEENPETAKSVDAAVTDEIVITKKSTHGRGAAATGGRKTKAATVAHVDAEDEQHDTNDAATPQPDTLPAKRTAAVIAALRTADDSPAAKKGRGRKQNVAIAENASEALASNEPITGTARGGRGAIGSRKVRFEAGTEASVTPTDSAPMETESLTAAPVQQEITGEKAPTKRGARTRRK